MRQTGHRHFIAIPGIDKVSAVSETALTVTTLSTKAELLALSLTVKDFI
jgi:hypothetical protein